MKTNVMVEFSCDFVEFKHFSEGEKSIKNNNNVAMFLAFFSQIQGDAFFWQCWIIINSTRSCGVQGTDVDLITIHQPKNTHTICVNKIIIWEAVSGKCQLLLLTYIVGYHTVCYAFNCVFQSFHSDRMGSLYQTKIPTENLEQA